MINTKKKPKIRGALKIFLNKKKLQHEDKIKYLGITIDRRFNFNQHIGNITAKCIKIIHTLSNSAKINCGLRHDVLRIIYTGAILPILSYVASVRIEGLKRNHNATKLKRVQRLTNIRIATAYRTTSHEAGCVLTGITPILIELGSLANIYHNARGNTQIGLYDAPKVYSKLNHPADAIELKKCEGREYTIEIYTDGSKSSSGVRSGIAIFVNKHLTLQLMYKLAEECSNNQAEQLATVKALEKLQDFRHLQEGQRSACIHTDSKITLDATANPTNQQNLVEQIREEVRRLEMENWTIHFTWVKAHNNNFGNELADQLAKKAASRREGETAYSKNPKNAVIKVIQREGQLEWQKERNASTKEEITNLFFSVIGDRKEKILQMGIKTSTLLTGHGTLRSYFHRFKIIDSPEWLCKMGPQTT